MLWCNLVLLGALPCLTNKISRKNFSCYLLIYLTIRLPVCLSPYMFTSLSNSLSASVCSVLWLSVCLPVFLWSICPDVLLSSAFALHFLQSASRVLSDVASTHLHGTRLWLLQRRPVICESICLPALTIACLHFNQLTGL